jgi:acetylornithine deacetylase/succinyl-diaminopimelate desuccinylase-like protein
MDPRIILKDLVGINSVNPFRTALKDGIRHGIGNETKIANYLIEVLENNQFTVEKQVFQEEKIVETDFDKVAVVPKRFNVLAEKGHGTKSILFFAHMDTVEDKEGWHTDPFEAITKVVDCKEKIYGLGAFDMKAGVAAILSATAQFNPEDYKIKIAFVSDEEYWSFGTESLLRTKFLDDVELIIVPEIADADKKTEFPSIILGRRGRIEYEFKIKGRSVHGALARVSKEAVNAVHEAIKLQNEIIKYCDESEKTFTYQDLGIKNSAYINYHYGGKGVISIPEYSRFLLDRSFIVNEDADKELQKLTEIAIKAQESGLIDKRAKVEISLRERPTPYCRPYFFDPEIPIIKRFTNEVEQFYKGYEYGIGYSVADENRLATLDIPVISFGPEGGNCHSPNEWVDVNSLMKLTDFFKQLLKNW